MATLTDLVETIAQAEGMEPATVALIARNVREAGLITTAGRGRSAAKMSSADATNLLIAVNATITAREAPQTVRIYRLLETRVGQILLGKLGDALQQLIDLISARQVPRQFLSCDIPPLIFQEFGNARIELSFHKPLPYAYLAISVLDGMRDFHGGLFCPEFPEYSHPGLKIADAIFFDFNLHSRKRQRETRKYGDRKDITSIGYSTIRAVADLLRQ